MRVASRARPRHELSPTVALLVCVAAACACAACTSFSGGANDQQDGISVAWTLDPSPPITGQPIVVRLTLRDRDQRPVTGARLKLEGLMSHPGMAPVVADLTERGEGVYEAPLQFTMAGDWIILVTGELPGGKAIKKQIEIAGVRPSS